MGRAQSGIRLLERALATARRTGAFDLGTSMLLVVGLGFLQNLLLARILGPGGVGHMAVIYSVVTVASLFGTLGLTSSILRYGAAAPGPGAAWQVFRSSVRVCAGASIGVALLTFAFSRSKLWVFDPVAAEWMPLVLFALPLQALGTCSSHFLQARDQMRTKAIVDFTSRFVTVLAVVTGALFHGFEGCVVGYTIGAVSGGAFAISRAVALRVRDSIRERIATRELLRFGAWGLLTNALGLGLVTADIFCVSALEKDSSQVGLYFLAVQLQHMIGIPMRAYLDARFPEMTRLAADPRALRALWRRMRWQLVGVATLGSVSLAAIAPFALPFVFGSDYAASALPLAILLLGQIARSFGDAAGRSMFAAGWVEGNFWLSGLSAALTIAGNLALIPHFGIVGAAMGTASASVLWAVTTTIVANRFDRSRGA